MSRQLSHAVIGIICLVFSSMSFPQAAARAYTVGVTPQFEARRLFEIWRPILDAVEKESGVKLTLRGSATIQEYEQQYFAGQFDFAYVNPYLIAVKNPMGYVPLVRDHGNGLTGVVVVRKNSPFRTPKDLDGKIVAFPAPDAVVACLFVRAQLESEYGVHVVPRFVRSHDSTYLNVLTGDTDAAGGAMSTLERQPPEIRSMLRILMTTKETAPIPFVASPTVPEDVRERVRKAFLQLGATDSGREMLAKIPISRIGSASAADYESIRHMGLERFFTQ